MFTPTIVNLPLQGGGSVEVAVFTKNGVKFHYDKQGNLWVAHQSRLPYNQRKYRKAKRHQIRAGYIDDNVQCGNMTRAHTYRHIGVLSAWKGPRPEGCDCDHINHNRLDNRLDNLRWLDKKTNRSQTRKPKKYRYVIEVFERANLSPVETTHNVTDIRKKYGYMAYQNIIMLPVGESTYNTRCFTFIVNKTLVK